MLGNGRVEAQCFDGTKRLAHIRGKMRKKVWINQGDIVLLSLRDFQDDKADVIVKYTPDEVSGEAWPSQAQTTRYDGMLYVPD
jgi:translation initiation factor 1A